MGFSSTQLRALRRTVSTNKIRTRSANGRELAHIEGWYAVSEANRIFGFENWDRETVEARCALARETRGTYQAVYIVKVRLSVRAEGTVVVREAHGTGEARGTSVGETHEMALKGAETDATKRALATFGRPFGLALYAPGRIGSASARIGHTEHEEATLIAPRNAEPQNANGRMGSVAPGSAVSLAVRSEMPEQVAPEITSLPPHPSRIRDKEHLRWVASQPCTVCGRTPSDPHHLRFSQPRALGLKVSDRFTVPLCRIHHREVHRTGDERRWWKTAGSDPLAVASALWSGRPGAYAGETKGITSEEHATPT